MKTRCKQTALPWLSFPVMALSLGMTACGSIQKHHRSGTGADDKVKLPASTGARILLQSTIVATAKAPVTTSKVGARMLFERTYSLFNGRLPATSMKMSRDQSSLPPAGSEAFEVLLDQEGLRERSLGSVRFFVDGASFFPDLYQAIDGAKQQIDVQSYIFDSDFFAMEVADRLKRKSFEVPVRVYFDSVGSLMADKVDPPVSPPPDFQRPRNLASYLSRNSKIKVRTSSNPYLVADHTKLHLIDDRIAFVGGMNVGAEYRFVWHDMMARIEGPIMRQLSSLYQDHWQGEEWQRNWGFSGWFQKETRDQSSTPVSSSERQVPLRMLLTDTPLGKREVLKATLAGIRCARRRIWIETPYFTVDEISRELESAVKRGVDVRVIIPRSQDSKFMDKANVAEMKHLLQTGVKVYEYPGMTHLKATICDNWGMFGSANYDTLSMRINRELNLATSDPATVKKLARTVFENDFRVSSRLTFEIARTRGGGRWAELLGDQL